MSYETERAKDLKRILNRKYPGPSSLDRLHDYVEEIFGPSVTSACGGCNAEEDACDECVIDNLGQLEWDMQTEIILFAEKLLSDWKSMNTA